MPKRYTAQQALDNAHLLSVLSATLFKVYQAAVVNVVGQDKAAEVFTEFTKLDDALTAQLTKYDHGALDRALKMVGL